MANIDLKERHKYHEKAFKYTGRAIWVILDMTIHYDETQKAISIRKIAELTNCSIQAIQKQLQMLEKLNVITITHNGHKTSVIALKHYSEWIEPAKRTVKRTVKQQPKRKKNRVDW